MDHRTKAEHECGDRCWAHVSRPLAASTVRQIHWILSGAMERAVRWRWIAVSPTGSAQPPPPPAPRPSPPLAKEAARLLGEAWKDEAWGTLVCLAMTTGARRGELCALRRHHLDLEEAALIIESGVAGSRARMREKDTKTRQKRRVALDGSTITVLNEHLGRQDRAAAALGLALDGTSCATAGGPAPRTGSVARRTPALPTCRYTSSPGTTGTELRNSLATRSV